MLCSTSTEEGNLTFETRLVLMFGNNVLWKLQGNFILILGKWWINIGVTLNIINFAEVMKKF